MFRKWSSLFRGVVVWVGGFVVEFRRWVVGVFSIADVIVLLGIAMASVGVGRIFDGWGLVVGGVLLVLYGFIYGWE